MQQKDILKKGKFFIFQDKKFFLYGIDTVLLVHFANIKEGDFIADLGSGNGIIPILLNMNYKNININAFEKQEEVFELSKKNIIENNITNTELINVDIINIDEKYYNLFDVVVTNPPYFKKNSNIINKNKYKYIARHETTATIDDFIRISGKLLKNRGRLYISNRPNRLVDIIISLKKYNLEPKLIRYVKPNKDKPANIMLIEAIKGANEELKHLSDLFVYDEFNKYTDEIKNIYKSVNIDVF